MFFSFFFLSCVRNWILFKSVRVFLKAWDGKRDSVKEREEIERKSWNFVHKPAFPVICCKYVY